MRDVSPSKRGRARRGAMTWPRLATPRLASLRATCVVTKYNVRKYKSIKLYTISDGPRVGLPKPNREDVCVPPSGLPVCESNPGKTLSYSDPQSGIGHDII